MPMYGFQCDDCQAEFETYVPRASAVGEVVCTQCGGQKLTRVLSLPAKTASSASNEVPTGLNCRGDGPACGAPWCGRGPTLN